MENTKEPSADHPKDQREYIQFFGGENTPSNHTGIPRTNTECYIKHHQINFRVVMRTQQAGETDTLRYLLLNWVWSGSGEGRVGSVSGSAWPIVSPAVSTICRRPTTFSSSASNESSSLRSSYDSLVVTQALDARYTEKKFILSQTSRTYFFKARIHTHTQKKWRLFIRHIIFS